MAGFAHASSIPARGLPVDAQFAGDPPIGPAIGTQLPSGLRQSKLTEPPELLRLSELSICSLAHYPDSNLPIHQNAFSAVPAVRFGGRLR